MHAPLDLGLFRHLYRVRTVLEHLIVQQTRNTMDGNTITAGIIIIGDEILKGQTHDTNSHFLCKRLFALGVQVKQISFIPDDLDVIAKVVSEFSGKFRHVITAGGIGPTHDDMTFEGVARAFDQLTKPHPEILQLIKEHFGSDSLDSAKLKMAEVPVEAQLQYGINKKTGEKTKYPLVSVRNVYMFPGVPSLLENSFTMLEYQFQNPEVSFHTDELYVNYNEVAIATDIKHVADQFSKTVLIGSYPDFHNSYYKVKVSLESTNEDELVKAVSQLKARMPAGSVVSYEKDPIRTAAQHVYDIVESKCDDEFHKSVQQAISVIETALDKYSLNEICLGFNGGKDCTTLLHLVHAVSQRKFPDHKGNLRALYIRSRLPFPEVELFLQESCKRYNLELIRFDGRIKDSLTQLKKQSPEIKAVLMGTRKTDPYADHLESFTMTDSDWPQFMRVNPVLNWKYATVWRFMRSLCLPYCHLYDVGYTSLGSMNNTHPNPKLEYTDHNSIVLYKPAYELTETGNERDGRN